MSPKEVVSRVFPPQIYEPFLDLSLPLVDHKPQRPVASGSKKVEDDEVDVSCFGKSKTKPDPEAAKSKHQVIIYFLSSYV